MPWLPRCIAASARPRGFERIDEHAGGVDELVGKSDESLFENCARSFTVPVAGSIGFDRDERAVRKLQFGAAPPHASTKACPRIEPPMTIEHCLPNGEERCRLKMVMTTIPGVARAQMLPTSTWRRPMRPDKRPLCANRWLSERRVDGTLVGIDVASSGHRAACRLRLGTSPAEEVRSLEIDLPVPQRYLSQAGRAPA